MLKKHFAVLLSSVLLLMAVAISCAVIFFTSPYRFLRPYTLDSAEELIGETGHQLSENGSHWLIRIHQTTHDFIPDFYIDQIPVTVADYQGCVASGKCSEPHYRNEYEKYYTEAAYAGTPVTFVTWQQAFDYCAAFGGTLPTELQWEIAAGILDGNTYPWGNEEPNLTRANYDGFYQELTPAGWLRNGATKDGVLDMAGNVREWVASLYFPQNEGKYDIDFRPSEVIIAELFKTDNLPIERILKGGGANDYPSALELRNNQFHTPNSSGFNRGFRCVYEVQPDSE